MSTVPQERREVPASEVKPGQHVVDGVIQGGIGEVTHPQPYTDDDRRECMALMVRPLLHPEPVVLYRTADCMIRLATDAEVKAASLAPRSALFNLVRAGVDAGLPLPDRIDMPINNTLFELFFGDDNPEMVDAWAAHLGMPDAARTGRVHRSAAGYRDFETYRSRVDEYRPLPGWIVDIATYMTVEPETADSETSTGDTITECAVCKHRHPAGKACTAHVSTGFGSRPCECVGEPFDVDVEYGAPGPDTPVEHRHVGGSVGPAGDCSAECACGVGFGGFNTHAEAAALLDEHIADEVPMADCTAPAIQRIQAYYEQTGGTHGAVYTCAAHRGEVIAALLAIGLRGRTQGTVSGEPCGHQVNHVVLGAPVLAAPTETAAEGARDATSADATATDPTGVDGRTSLPVRADAVPAAPSGEGGAAGITPPSYDPMPTCIYSNLELRRVFHATYAADLDRTNPGWHTDDVGRMSHELAAEAYKRRNARNGSGQ